MGQQPPDNPAGPIEPIAEYDEHVKNRLIGIVRNASAQLRRAVAGLSEEHLDTRYKNWTIRR